MVATSAIHALITHISVPDTHGHCTKWRYWCQSLVYTVQCIRIFAAHNWNIICWERATATECSYIFPLCGQCYQKMSLNMYETPHFRTRDTCTWSLHHTSWTYWCQSLPYTVQYIRISCNIWWERVTATECSYLFSFCGQYYQRMPLNIPWWGRVRNMSTTVICTSCGQRENIVGSLPASFQGLLNLFHLHYANQLGRPEMFLPHNM